MNLKLNGLAEGSYWLVETQAPDGYNKLTAPVKITITKSDTTNVDDWTIKQNDGVVDDKIIDIENTTGTLLPETGGMKFARTVCGDIQAEEMGFTYPHEHLYAVPPTCQKDRDLEVSDYEGSVAELKLFKSVGGQTLVEASTLDYGRNLSLLKKMSEETGVHVIATTGFNKHIYYPNWVEEKSTEEISDILADDILEGRDGIRAGFIKIGTYYNMIHPLEEKTAVAAAQAQKRCGAPIWGHTEAGTMGMELLDILARDNVDFSTVALGHLDRNPDEYYLLKLASENIFCTVGIRPSVSNIGAKYN